MDWQWTWDWAVLWWIVPGLFLVLLIAGVKITSNKSPKVAKAFVTATATVVVVEGLIMLLVGSIAHGASKGWHQNMSYATVSSRVFGLTSGEAYPLELGSRSGGTQVHGGVSGSLFAIAGTVSSAPSSSFPVSFQQESKTYMLDLPVSKVTFIRSTTLDPSITLVINEIDPAMGSNVGVPLGTVRYPSCHTVIHDFIATCVHDGEWVIEPSDQTVRQGLAPIVQAGLDSAIVVLTPEMYDRLLGKIS